MNTMFCCDIGRASGGAKNKCLTSETPAAGDHHIDEEPFLEVDVQGSQAPSSLSRQHERCGDLLRETSNSGTIKFGKEVYNGSPGEGVRVVLHGKPRVDSGLNEYRAIIDISGVDPDTFAETYFEVEGQVERDPAVYSAYHTLEAESSCDITLGVEDTQTMRCVAILPWPLSDREYVMLRRVVRLPDESFFSFTEDTDRLDETWPRGANKTVRVVALKSYCYIQPWTDCDGVAGTRMTSLYYEDSGGNIPSRVTNHIATRVTPTSFAKIREICVERMEKRDPRTRIDRIISEQIRKEDQHNRRHWEGHEGETAQGEIDAINESIATEQRADRDILNGVCMDGG